MSDRILRISFLAVMVFGTVCGMIRQPFSGRVSAQELEQMDVVKLNLAQSVKLALEYNSTLEKQEVVIQKKVLKVKDANTDFFPDVRLRGWINEDSFEDSDTGFGANVVLTGGGLEGWSKVSQKKISELDLALNRLIKQNKEIEVEYLTIQTNLSAIYAQEEVQAQQKILELSQDNFKRLQIEFENKRRSLLEVQQAEETILNIQLEHLEAKARLEKNLNDLSTLLGLASHKKIELDHAIDLQPFIKAEDLTIKMVLDQNPSLKTQRKRIEMIQEFAFFKKLGRWPSPYAEAGYQRNPSPRVGTVEVSDETDQWWVILGLQWKIFDWNKSKRQYEQANLDLKKEKIRLGEIKREVQAKWLHLTAKEDQLSQSKQLLEKRWKMIENQLKLSQNLFDQGKIDFNELTDIYKRQKRNHLRMRENHFLRLLNYQEMIYLSGQSTFAKITRNSTLEPNLEVAGPNG
jgi:outer membrane protein TolC